MNQEKKGLNLFIYNMLRGFHNFYVDLKYEINEMSLNVKKAYFNPEHPFVTIAVWIFNLIVIKAILIFISEPTQTPIYDTIIILGGLSGTVFFSSLVGAIYNGGCEE